MLIFLDKCRGYGLFLMVVAFLVVGELGVLTWFVFLIVGKRAVFGVGCFSFRDDR